MKARLIPAALVAVLATSAAGQGPANPTNAAPRIVTAGEGQVRVAPDRATIMVGVQTRATTASVAGTNNARTQKAILDTLKALGIPPEQLTTQNYSVYPEMQYTPNTGASRVIGYNVSNVVRVELKNIEQVGRVIDAALAKGANQIQSIQFTASNAADARRRAMAEAVADARADAEALAKAAGGSLGALIELTSASSSPIRPVFATADMAMAKAANVQTPIEPGEQTLTANVTAIWAFLPGSGR